MFYIVKEKNLNSKKDFILATCRVTGAKSFFIITKRNNVKGHRLSTFFFSTDWDWNVEKILKLPRLRRARLMNLLKSSNLFVYDAVKQCKQVYDFLTREVKEREREIERQKRSKGKEKDLTLF